MTDYKTKQVLNDVLMDAKAENIRLLIEVEPFGKMHVWTDRKHKRAVLRMIRTRGVGLRPMWQLTDEKMNYPEPQSVHYLRNPKGKVARRF